MAGTAEFKEKVADKIVGLFKISKRETKTFKYTGVDVCQEENGDIVIRQTQYKDSLEEIPVHEDENLSRPLSKEEFKSFRGAIGKITWLSEMTRPDLQYDCLEMSCRSKDAKVEDIVKINRLIRRAK